jgi:hypothetical protein
MIVLEIVGIVALVGIVLHFLLNWPEWLGYEPEPSTHIAGPDDEDVDFEAALRSIGRVPR